MKTKDKKTLTLIKKLKDKALELGRSPTRRGMKNPYVYIGHFGSWNAALVAAGLEISKNQVRHDKKDLIKILLSWHKKHKKIPAMRDFNKDTDTPNSSTYLKYFGSWNNALKEAGIKRQIIRIDINDISKEDLLKIFKDEYLRIKPTSCRDFNNRRNKDKVPSVNRIIRHLNMSWSDLLVKINIPTADIMFMNIPEERLFKKVRGIAKKLKKPPSITEFDKYQDLTTSVSLINRFGGWNNFLKSAGLLPKHKAPVNVPEDNKSLLKMYKEFSIKIGKEESGATKPDLEVSDDIYSSGVFVNRFGSIQSLRKLLDMKSRKRSVIYSKEYIFNHLLVVCHEHGVFTHSIINSIDYLPSVTTIKRHLNIDFHENN